ncbi:MAG: hypothetical protein GWO24_28865, partial [Akkermansiaceae bacterium]|nr:hypothetical protein [Akkermansiaceae bacterium]
ELPDREVRALILNGHQLADPHDIGLGKTAVLIDSEAPLTVRRVWGMLLPVLVHSHAVSFGPSDDAGTLAGFLQEKVKLRDLVGTARLRELVKTRARGGERLCCYQFGAGPQRARDAEERIFSCFEAGNRILSLSIAPTPRILKSDVEQAGSLEGSYGRVLTGFVASEENGVLTLEGEMLEDRIELPGWSLDEGGFLWGRDS